MVRVLLEGKKMQCPLVLRALLRHAHEFYLHITQEKRKCDTRLAESMCLKTSPTCSSRPHGPSACPALRNAAKATELRLQVGNQSQRESENESPCNMGNREAWAHQDR